MKLAIITAHAGAECFRDAVMSWTCPAGGTVPIFVQDGLLGMLPAYQRGFVVSEGFEFLAFFHDDTIIKDQWLGRLIFEFADPQVGLVGFGGALGHGSPSLYREPYEYHQLGRSDFLSNMDDAESHGKRFAGSCDVAVLDGFALIVRREILEKCGGWPVEIPHDWQDFAAVGGGIEFSTCRRCYFRSDSPVVPPCPSPIGYVCYDYWLSCMTRRLGYRIRLVGVPCQHLGGQTFVKLGIGKDPKHWQQYLDSHRYIYDTFSDVIPYTVPQ